jgi:hypothetical protein
MTKIKDKYFKGKIMKSNKLILLLILAFSASSVFAEFSSKQRKRVAAAKRKCDKIPGASSNVVRAESSNEGELCYKHVCEVSDKHNSTGITEKAEVIFVGCMSEGDVGNIVINGGIGVDSDGDLDIDGDNNSGINVNVSGGGSGSISIGHPCYKSCARRPSGRKCRKCIGTHGGNGGISISGDISCSADMDIDDCLSEARYRQIVSGMYTGDCADSCKEHWLGAGLNGLANLTLAAGPMVTGIVGAVQGRKSFEALMGTTAFGMEQCRLGRQGYLDYSQQQQDKFVDYNVTQHGPMLLPDQYGNMTVGPDMFNNLTCNGYGMGQFSGFGGMMGNGMGGMGNMWGNAGYSNPFQAGMTGQYGQFNPYGNMGGNGGFGGNNGFGMNGGFGGNNGFGMNGGFGGNNGFGMNGGFGGNGGLLGGLLGGNGVNVGMNLGLGGGGFPGSFGNGSGGYFPNGGIGMNGNNLGGNWGAGSGLTPGGNNGGGYWGANGGWNPGGWNGNGGNGGNWGGNGGMQCFQAPCPNGNGNWGNNGGGNWGNNGGGNWGNNGGGNWGNNGGGNWGNNGGGNWGGQGNGQFGQGNPQADYYNSMNGSYNDMAYQQMGLQGQLQNAYQNMSGSGGFGPGNMGFNMNAGVGFNF